MLTEWGNCPFMRFRTYPSCYQDCPDTGVCPVEPIAQRATVCPDCGDTGEVEKIEYHGAVSEVEKYTELCPECKGNGYIHRLPVAELGETSDKHTCPKCKGTGE